MAASLTFVIAKGEDVTFTGTHQVSSSDNTPVDVSNWIITITIKNRATGVTVFTTIATVTSGIDGEYAWSVASDDMMIAAATYSIDIWRTEDGGRRAMGIGTFQIAPDVLYGS